MKRYKLIACGVLKREVEKVRGEIPDDIDLEVILLEQGLHRTPATLNELIRERITAIEESDEPLDAILLGYGICSSGTIGVSSTRYRIVIPRAHDCITLFLGSKERYLDEFSRAPGTYWFTPGFIGGPMQPGLSEKYAGIYRQYEENYEEYLKQFGDEESARYVIDSQEQAWIGNYSRGAYVDSGLPGGDALHAKARDYCAAREWSFEEIRGDLSLVRDLIAGNWDDERFCILEPGQELAIGGVEDVVTARKTDDIERFEGDDYTRSFVFDDFFREILPGADFGNGNEIDRVVGIDAGGTYTDAVIVSLGEKKVLASSKASTTHHDLGIGISEALQRLPAGLLAEAQRIALSTTLATNAIVEGTGARTGLVLIGYGHDTAALVAVGAGDVKTLVTGRHDIYGTEIEPLDETGLRESVEELIIRGVEAIAISSYLATRNPNHELRAREIIESMHDIPVVTGHDITDDIDSVRRAHTVLLNAHLIPVIGRLIRSVGSVVAELGITDDIRLVTTEGTLMNAAEALEQPVRLVLSGPAASVKGVRFLTDFNSCVLVDMGGTTSDVAVIEGGRAKRTGRGAVVGNFRTSIHATDMRTIGLGGDSAVTWKRGVLTVGPRRILPLCVCADTYPEITGAIEKLAGYSSSDYELIQPGTCFFVSRPQETTAYLTERERAILDILGDRPLTAVELADRLSYPYHSLLGTERLEEHGIIGRAGLTPTDICVAENRLSMGNAEAARIAVELYCERTGLGFDEICEAVWREVRRSLAAVIVSETAGVLPQDKSFPGCGYCAALLDQNGLVESRYRLTVPLVGIGAPAGLMMAGLDDFLGAEKVFPEQAAVANAVGAASAAGGMHIDLSIIPDSSGRYVLYAPGENIRFRNLPEAKARGFELAQIYAESYAGRMGYGWFALDIFVHDRTAPTATMGSIYLDTSIVANMRY